MNCMFYIITVRKASGNYLPPRSAPAAGPALAG